MNATSDSLPVIDDPQLVRALEEYAEAREDGRRPCREEILARYADPDGVLAKCIDALDFVRSAAPQLQTPDAEESTLESTVPLGDYRIEREIGRGGMGVVYEARQLSLGRRVALKVLPFAATLDSRQLVRFQNEARAAASLEHPHIVPVYGVGCERGVHYYAMRFIEGLSLDAVLQQLRAKKQSASPPSALEPDPSAAVAQKSQVSGGTKSRAGLKSTLDKVRGKASTIQSNGCAKNRIHQIAKIGVQAATALEHAHQSGVVHRDIKPANLLVDNEGHLWVTDFGLAQIQSDPRLTMTGDLVGTLRYMSPEQALAKRVIVDHRTDIYSLGATLYELLTLQPVFSGEDRQELLRQIAFEEPVAARKVNREVPVELETVVAKALEKNPDDRYSSAKDLADDLKRYLNDEPTMARRPGMTLRARKWARRHVAAVRAAAMAAFVIITALAGMAGWWLNDQAVRQAVAVDLVNEALTVMEPKLREGNPYDQQLVSAARRAEAQLASGLIPLQLRERANELLADWMMLEKIESIRLEVADDLNESGITYDSESSNKSYTQAFRAFGIDVESLDPPTASELIKRRTIAVHLTAALDDWSRVRKIKEKNAGTESWKRLLEVARAADPDPWRDSLRTALDQKNAVVLLMELAKTAPTQQFSAFSMLKLAHALWDREEKTLAIDVLRDAQQRFPASFWLNHDLGWYLNGLKQPRPEEAIGFYRVAVALRPLSPGVHSNLGSALSDAGRAEEANASFQQALKLKPDQPILLLQRGVAFKKNKEWEKAIADFERAILIKPDYAAAHNNLGLVFLDTGDDDKAFAAFDKAIEHDPKYWAAYSNRALLFSRRNEIDRAIAVIDEAIKQDPKLADAYYLRGNLLSAKGNVDLAIDSYQKALEYRPGFPAARVNLSVKLKSQGRVQEAIDVILQGIGNIKQPNVLVPRLMSAGFQFKNIGQNQMAFETYRQALALRPKDAEAQNFVAWYLVTLADIKSRDPATALGHAKTAVELNSKSGAFWKTLGVCYYRNDLWKDAVDALQESIKLVKGTEVSDCFYLAMSYRRLGEKDKAHKYFDEGSKWLDKNPQTNSRERYLQLRAEAAELLGIQLPVDKGKDKK